MSGDDQVILRRLKDDVAHRDGPWHIFQVKWQPVISAGERDVKAEFCSGKQQPRFTRVFVDDPDECWGWQIATDVGPGSCRYPWF